MIGSVGTPLPDLEVKLAEDGEILVRGGNVMSGYYKDEKATNETIDSDGWLHSGDVGVLNEHNYLKITDRKKDIIITAGGKNIAPQEIENRLKTKHALISQVVVIGDKRPFLTALITLDEEKAPSWAARSRGSRATSPRSPTTSAPRRRSRARSTRSTRASRRSRGSRSSGSSSATSSRRRTRSRPTMKVKRKTINEIYAEVIEDMYSKDTPSMGAGKAPVRT